MTIKTKVSLGFGLLTVIVLVIGAVNWVGNGWVVGASEAAYGMKGIEADLGRVEAARDGFQINPGAATEKVVLDRLGALEGDVSRLRETPSFSALVASLDSILGNLRKFGDEFAGYVSLDREARRRMQENQEAARAFRLSAQETAVRAEARAARLSSLIKRVDDQLDGAVDGGATAGVAALVQAAQRLRGRVEAARTAASLAQALVEQGLLVETGQLTYMLDGSEASEQSIEEAAKNIFLTALKLKKAAPEESGTAVATALSAVNAIRANFQAIKDLESKRTGALAAMSEEGAAVRAEIARTVEAARSEMEDAEQTISRLTLVGVLVAAMLGLGVSVAIVRGVVGPIATMTRAMDKLAEGDTSVAIPALENRDEIGRMAKAVQVFKDNKEEADRLAAAQQADEAAKAARAARIDQLIGTFDREVGSVLDVLSSTANEMTATAENMSALSGQTSQQASAVATATDEASSNVEVVATAAEELAASIAEIERQVAKSADVARQAVSDAEGTRGVVAGLSDAVNKIGDVLGLITDIAEQTNLLALNATIEAARAGEAGKGFAVVAGEVKSLATQTAHATGEIAQQIGQVQAATRDAVDGIGEISRVVAVIDEIATAVASAVEEQGVATQEIARNVQMASAGTREVTTRIADVTDAAVGTGSAASQVLGTAEGLSRHSNHLGLAVEQFLEGVRAE
jgi:methyl-accepting chemotaxis protein